MSVHEHYLLTKFLKIMPPVFVVSYREDAYEFMLDYNKRLINWVLFTNTWLSSCSF